MKKILVSMFLLVFALCAVGCEWFSKGVKLEHQTYEVSQDKFGQLTDKYNLYDYVNKKRNYYVIDNYTDYCNIYYEITGKDIEPLSEEDGKKLFENNVKLIEARSVSGSSSFIPVECYYDKNSNSIQLKQVNEPDKNSDYPTVIVAYCIDIIEIPKDIYQELKNK